MNPILRTRGTIIVYSALIFLLAFAYGMLLSRGTGMTAWCVAVDIFFYGLVWGFWGIILWNLLHYAIPLRNGMLHPLWTIFAGIISTVFIAGTECLVMWVCLGDGFSSFAQTIPVRIFVTALIFIMFLLYYIADAVAKRDDGPVPASRVKEGSPETLQRITLKTGGKIKVVSLSEIEYLQADGDYVAVVTAEGRWLKEQTMKYFEEHLPEDNFIRIHRSYIVGMSKIARIERYGNLYQVALRSGEKIKVSANGYKLLKERLRL